MLTHICSCENSQPVIQLKTVRNESLVGVRCDDDWVTPFNDFQWRFFVARDSQKRRETGSVDVQTVGVIVQTKTNKSLEIGSLIYKYSVGSNIEQVRILDGKGLLSLSPDHLKTTFGLYRLFYIL